MLERLTKKPLGWVVERLAAPLGRWDRARLDTPEVAIPVPDLPPEFAGYRMALVTDLHHGPAVPTRWLERVADRVAELAPDLVVLGGDFISYARSDLDGLEPVLARLRGREAVLNGAARSGRSRVRGDRAVAERRPDPEALHVRRR